MYKNARGYVHKCMRTCTRMPVVMIKNMGGFVKNLGNCGKNKSIFNIYLLRI